MKTIVAIKSHIKKHKLNFVIAVVIRDDLVKHHVVVWLMHPIFKEKEEFNHVHAFILGMGYLNI